MRSPLVLALLLVLAPVAAPAEQLADGIAAQVGSDIVLISEVMEAAAPTAARAPPGPATPTCARSTSTCSSR